MTCRQGEDRLNVQNGFEGVLVQTNQKAAVAEDSEVEIVGYARAGDYSPFRYAQIVVAPEPDRAVRILTSIDSLKPACKIWRACSNHMIYIEVLRWAQRLGKAVSQ
jgi:hypothetical protein